MSSSDLKRPASPLSNQDQRPTKVVKEDHPSTAQNSGLTAVSSVVDASTGVTAPTSTLLIKRLAPQARLPTRGSALAAGYDLYSGEQTVIPPGGKALVNTHISLAVPIGTYGRVAPRSGLASKHMIATGAGVVDADYRGPLYVLLFNHSDKEFQIAVGDRIAQLILEKIETPPVVEVEDLEATTRGAGGFGSTGM